MHTFYVLNLLWKFKKKHINWNKIDISSEFDFGIVSSERESEKMNGVEEASSSNGNAQRTIFGRNLVVNRNTSNRNANADADADADANANTFDKLLTDLEEKVNLASVEVEQIKSEYLKLKGIKFSFSHLILLRFDQFS